jgi:hypothetical protein
MFGKKKDKQPQNITQTVNVNLGDKDKKEEPTTSQP